MMIYQTGVIASWSDLRHKTS